MQSLLTCDVPTLPPFEMKTCRVFAESLIDSVFAWTLLSERACSPLRLPPAHFLHLLALLQIPPSDRQ